MTDGTTIRFLLVKVVYILNVKRRVKLASEKVMIKYVVPYNYIIVVREK